MTRYPSVAILVHWGDPRATAEVAMRYHRDRSFSKVVVVANDFEACPRKLKGSDISWIIPQRNLGFGGGCNFGARRYEAKKYAFLNADVTFKPGAISACLEALDLPNVGITAPALYFPNGGLQSGCGSVSKYMKVPHVGAAPIGSLRECEWVTGAALFCRHEVTESVGFDGSYFLGFEDVDIGRRARLNGWKVVVVSRGIAIHPGRVTLKGARPVYYGVRNQVWFSRRYGSFLGSALASIYVMRSFPRILAVDVVKRRPSHARLMLHGLRAGWSKLPGVGEPLPDEPIPSRWIDWRRNQRLPSL
jgi:N-acetylglucosaminyl-diphospho-decaprenol L-rhamnosyltransferase